MKNDERGAVLIYTAIASFVLFALGAFVLDAGVMWTARRQAQNSADAAALAAGTALLYDAYGDRASTGPAHQSGVAIAALNPIMGPTSGVLVEQSMDATGWTPPAPETCTDVPGSCVQASVFRDGTNGSTPLPRYFSALLGVTSQQVRATATVQMRAANAVHCMKPWFIKDKGPVATYTLADVGTLLVARTNLGPSNYQQITLDKSGAKKNCPNGGGKCYGNAIQDCIVGKDSNDLWEIGDVMNGKPGGTNGQQTTPQLYAQDPGATWNPLTKSVEHSCAATQSCACATTHTCANGFDGRISPRIVAVALFAPADVDAASGSIRGFAGMFMLQPGTGPDPGCVGGSNVCGYLMPTPGLISNGGTPAQGQTLNVTLSLIR